MGRYLQWSTVWWAAYAHLCPFLHSSILQFTEGLQHLEIFYIQTLWNTLSLFPNFHTDVSSSLFCCPSHSVTDTASQREHKFSPGTSLCYQFNLTLILQRSHMGTVWFYTSTSNKRAARPKLYTKSLTRDLKLMYSRLTLVRISINL